MNKTMNRRSFITRALAAAALIPSFGKVELLYQTLAPAVQPVALTALIPTLYDAMDMVQRDLVGFIPTGTHDERQR